MGADMKGRLFTAALFCTAIALGCAENPKEPSVEPSGFLGDYSQLAPGREGQARLIYFNPEAYFSLYDKMLIAPVAECDLGSVLIGGAEIRHHVLFLHGHLSGRLHASMIRDYGSTVATQCPSCARNGSAPQLTSPSTERERSTARRPAILTCLLALGFALSAAGPASAMTCAKWGRLSGDQKYARTFSLILAVCRVPSGE